MKGEGSTEGNEDLGDPLDHFFCIIDGGVQSFRGSDPNAIKVNAWRNGDKRPGEIRRGK